MEHKYEQRRYTQHMCLLFLDIPLAWMFEMTPKHRISVDSWYARVQQDSKQIQDWYVLSLIKKGRWWPQEALLSIWIRNILTQIESNAVLRNKSKWGAPIISFHELLPYRREENFSPYPSWVLLAGLIIKLTHDRVAGGKKSKFNLNVQSSHGNKN